jgi:hypothetical protein
VRGAAGVGEIMYQRAASRHPETSRPLLRPRADSDTSAVRRIAADAAKADTESSGAGRARRC